jgi:hypothetical protein
MFVRRSNARRRSMDELALLKEFRLDDASSNGAREDARAALRAAAARQRRSRRRTFVVLAFIGAAILAGAAYGIVHELVVGSPAPEEVREQPARFGHSAELIPVPHPEDPRLDQARVAAVLKSSAGTVYLFASPNAGSLCASTWLEGDRGYQGRLNLPTACGNARDQSFYAFGNHDAGISAGHDFDKHPLRLFWGRAGDGVARIALRFGSRVVGVPMTGRWFLAEFPTQPDEFLSYGAGGRVLERQKFDWSMRREPVAKPPHQMTQAHEVARIGARGGSEDIRLLVARASDGGFCQIVRSDRTPTNQTCSVAPPTAREIGVAAMNFGGAPGGILLFVGPVGSDIAKLELRYQNGRVATIPLREGWALYEVERADYAEGRRPEILIGRDVSGREIASQRLPWATPAG